MQFFILALHFAYDTLHFALLSLPSSVLQVWSEVLGLLSLWMNTWAFPNTFSAAAHSGTLHQHSCRSLLAPTADNRLGLAPDRVIGMQGHLPTRSATPGDDNDRPDTLRDHRARARVPVLEPSVLEFCSSGDRISSVKCRAGVRVSGPEHKPGVPSPESVVRALNTQPRVLQVQAISRHSRQLWRRWDRPRLETGRWRGPRGDQTICNRLGMQLGRPPLARLRRRRCLSVRSWRLLSTHVTQRRTGVAAARRGW